MALLALLVAAPAASASTASLRNGSTVVYQGDAGADRVTLGRFVTEDGDMYYTVRDEGGISSGRGCVRMNRRTSKCEVSGGLKRYDISTGDGNDTVDVTGATAGGTADLATGADGFTNSAPDTAADTVTGGDGTDTIDGGAGND